MLAWLYFWFRLSFRVVEEIAAVRGILVTYETIRQWHLKFASVGERPATAANGSVITIAGTRQRLWRAVGQEDLPTFLSAAPTQTPPRSFIPTATKHSPPAPR